LLEREKRSAERRLKAARFPTIKTLESFDFAARPSVNKVLIAELARCKWLYAFEWGELVRILGGFGLDGQVTPPA
jgi:DNA replication protein DnaC